MRKAQIAEWLLRSVTSQERAAATTGDLLESAPQHGELWFWYSLLRTVGAQIGRELAARPRTNFWLGFRGMWVGIFYFLIWLVGIVIVGTPFAYFHWGTISGGLTRIAGVIAGYGISYFVGRWLARAAPEHRLTAVVSYCLVMWTFGIMLSIVFLAFHAPMPARPWQQVISETLQSLPANCTVLAGALFTRSRAVAG